jgi:hypothetical protein
MYSEAEIKRMLAFFIDNIFVVFGGHVLQQSVGIPMDTNRAPLIVDLLYIMRGNIFKSFYMRGKKSFVVAFNLTF